MSQLAAKKLPSISWNGSTFTFSASSQKTLLSGVLKYSCSSAVTVDVITSELQRSPRQRNVFYEPLCMVGLCTPQITRPRAQVEDKSREDLGHYGVGLEGQQRVLETSNSTPQTSANVDPDPPRDNQTYSIGV